MARSQNGYPANDINRTEVRRIPGTTRDIRLSKGAPGWLLLHFAGWFDKNIESVDTGILDDWGYAERPIRGARTTLSNHASGTAIDLNAPRHPLGAVGTFSDEQVEKIRAQLKVYEGCIRWGGDYNGRKDEMHFEINAPAAEVRRVRDKLKAAARAAAKPKPVPTIKTSQLVVAAKGGRPAPGQVKLVQAALNAVTGAGLVVDGDWGPATTAAYKNFQQSLGRRRTGVPARPELVALAAVRFLVVA